MLVGIYLGSCLYKEGKLVVFSTLNYIRKDKINGSLFSGEKASLSSGTAFPLIFCPRNSLCCATGWAHIHKCYFRNWIKCQMVVVRTQEAEADSRGQFEDGYTKRNPDLGKGGRKDGWVDGWEGIEVPLLASQVNRPASRRFPSVLVLLTYPKSFQELMGTG